MPLYELINPSDPYTFTAPNIEVAGVCVALLSTGFGARCIDDSSDESTPILFGWDDWLKDRGITPDWVDSHRSELADCWDSFVIGSADERRTVDEAMAEMTPEQREAFRSKRQDRKRSSMNRIGEAAYAKAKAARKAVAWLVEKDDLCVGGSDERRRLAVRSCPDWTIATSSDGIHLVSRKDTGGGFFRQFDRLHFIPKRYLNLPVGELESGQWMDMEADEVWRVREGQPWQADIEAHVAAYRAEPRQLTAEYAQEMFGEGKPLADLDICIYPGPNNTRIYQEDMDRGPRLLADVDGKPKDALPTATFRAACKAALAGS